MALRIDANTEHAYAPNPWSGGDFTIVFWMRRLGVTTTKFQCGLLDTDDTSPESSGDPRVTVGTSSSNLMVSTYVGNGGSSSDSVGSYATSGWSHVAAVFTATGLTITGNEIFVDAVGSGSPSTASRDTSINGTLDRFQLGYLSSNHSTSDFAHVAYYSSALSQSQITELQTKLPTAITGASPVLYYPLIDDVLNDGSGGSTYDLTVSGATLDSTNDGSIPSLSSGGQTGDLAATESGADVLAIDGDVFVSGSVVATEASNDTFFASGSETRVGSMDATETDADVLAIDGDVIVIGSIALIESGVDVLAIDGDVYVSGSLTVNEVGSDTFVGLSSSGAIRLTLGIYRERGGFYDNASALRYVVFNADHTDVVASGTNLTTDASGVATLNLNGTPYAVGDYVPVLITEYNNALAPQDRTVRTMFGFVPATAQT